MKGKVVQFGIRVINAYFEEEDRIELIEIYYPDEGSLRDKGDKGDKENEDRKRIIKHYN
jgi:hypothetical protein